jgi:CubicO group peptidase (beta-lactamase class C family)
MKLLADYGHSVDEPFYPLVQTQFPIVGPGVNTVTIRNLLEMKSGMTPNGELFPDNIRDFLSTYLQQQNVPANAPGSVEACSNKNFTILQAVIATVTGHGGQTTSYYVAYVSEKVLTPMGVNVSVFNATPDPPPSRHSHTAAHRTENLEITGSQSHALPPAGGYLQQGGWLNLCSAFATTSCLVRTQLS